MSEQIKRDECEHGNLRRVCPWCEIPAIDEARVRQLVIGLSTSAWREGRCKGSDLLSVAKNSTENAEQDLIDYVMGRAK